MAEKRRRAPRIRAEYIDRSNWSGFLRYWSVNPIHFATIFGDMTYEKAYESLHKKEKETCSFTNPQI